MASLGICAICGDERPTISNSLKVCLACIRNNPEKAIRYTDEAHVRTRDAFGLPPLPPSADKGLECGMCGNQCVIGDGGKGFCGLVSNIGGRLIRNGGTPEKGILEWYYDPLPTNCVAWWFCPGCTGLGYPKYAKMRGAEKGYSNLAVFYGSCSFDCLFCQNWHFRYLSQKLSPAVSASELAEKVDAHVSCICFFGGDPSTQMPHALMTSELALARAKGEKRILRVCWETNGNMQRNFLIKAADLSLMSGGVMKFDLKAWDENLHRALCGVSNKRTLENFRVIGEEYFKERPDVPVLTASTLLIPGYIDAEEVERIASFIASIDPKIPYTLLAFYPQYAMRDLPLIDRIQAEKCYQAARKHLNNVRLGNLHLIQ
ncbi:MAG: radical SAM protein [Nitrososphaerota archaeon]|nr:radical SAM protein [Candidatus Bathyarchaeota archaeon]MDW8048843.1 radical SAM protein [Nitrososphaerota archaeon]